MKFSIDWYINFIFVSVFIVVVVVFFFSILLPHQKVQESYTSNFCLCWFPFKEKTLEWLVFLVPPTKYLWQKGDYYYFPDPTREKATTSSPDKMPLMAFHGMLNVASFIPIVCFTDF